MEKEYHADQGHDDHLFEELFFEGVDGSLDQRGAVVGRANLDAGRKARFELGEAALDAFDDLVGILAETDDDDASHGFAATAPLGQAASDVRSHAHLGDVGEVDRCTFFGRAEADAAQVVEIP